MAEHTALKEQHVVVVGAGIGGLICALLLANRGHSCHAAGGSGGARWQDPSGFG